MVAYFAIAARGLVVVPILPDFSSAEAENVISHSEAKVLIVSERLKSKISQVTLDGLNAVIKVDDLSVLSGEKTKSEEKIEHTTIEDDIAAIIYTSGTTGRSKGVVLTHKNIAFVVMQSYNFQAINSDDIFLSFLPLSHTYENSIGMLYPIMYGASIYYLEKPPTAASLLPALGKIRPTMMMSVPLIMEKLYKNQIQAKFNKNKFSRGI